MPAPSAESDRTPGTVRTLIGGALMGVANIIPGVSGGTMILATGLYEPFVRAVADVSRLRLRLASIKFLAVLIVAAVIAIGASVYPITWGLDHIHHVMFALFIGLTLGGVPLLVRELSPMQPSAMVSAALGFAVMAVLAFALSDHPLPETWTTFLVAGVIASAAMVLPGISGSYLLLIFGLYAPLTSGIRGFLEHARGGELDAAMAIVTGLLIPVGLGVVLGIAGLTNALKALMGRFHQGTVGFLLGLLLGSVLGLYPFKDLVEKGEVRAVAPELTLGNVLLVLVAAIVGFAATVAISRLGGEAEGGK